MNKKKTNKYQLLTLICLVLAMVYGWAFYRSFHNFGPRRNFNLWLNGLIMLAWLLLGLYHFSQYKKAREEES